MMTMAKPNINYQTIYSPANNKPIVSNTTPDNIFVVCVVVAIVIVMVIIVVNG
jgi:hypothetical protein